MNLGLQKKRLIIASFYLLLLMCASYILFRSLLPPPDGKGTWFYAGLASVIIGQFLTNPFFSSPADVIANSIAALITMLSIKPMENQNNQLIVSLWWILMGFLTGVLVLAIVAVFVKQESKTTKSRNYFTFCHID